MSRSVISAVSQHELVPALAQVAACIRRQSMLAQQLMQAQGFRLNGIMIREKSNKKYDLYTDPVKVCVALHDYRP